jgi:manganese/zinc/iron transport system permease protein
LGIGVAFWHYALMGAVSLTTVVSFESVGAILVVAFLIVPPATAYLITNELKKMLFLSSIFGIISAIGGYYLAVLINGSIAGAIASIAGLLFLIVWVITLIRKRQPI